MFSEPLTLRKCTSWSLLDKMPHEGSNLRIFKVKSNGFYSAVTFSFKDSEREPHCRLQIHMFCIFSTSNSFIILSLLGLETCFVLTNLNLNLHSLKSFFIFLNSFRKQTLKKNLLHGRKNNLSFACSRVWNSQCSTRSSTATYDTHKHIQGCHTRSHGDSKWRRADR